MSNPAKKEDLPLHDRWTLWFDNPRIAPPGSDWKENLKQIATVHSIGDFWQVFNNVKPASEIGTTSNYSIFREGIDPSWEDPANENGGKFVFEIPKKDSRNPRFDRYWLYTVLACIGETLSASCEVNGAVVSLRKNQDKIALWLKCDDKAACTEIGKRWKKALDLDRINIKYQTHKDAMASGRSFRNQSYFEV